MRRLAAALMGVVLLTGCANIPDGTQPKFVQDVTVVPPTVGAPEPGLDPYTVVQQFIKQAGSPAVAETYLTPEAKAEWQGTAEPTIVRGGFKTLPQAVPDRDVLNEQVIVVSADQVGRLTPDGSFFTSVQPVEYRIVVRRQQDRQWRIADAPRTLLITEADFSVAYRRVGLQFFDPEQRVMVPDLRYVLAEPREGLEFRVVNLLLNGPSESLKNAVRTQLEGVTLRTNVVRESDGAVLINFVRLDKSEVDRERLAAQVVNSLGEVTSSPLRLRSEGERLLPGVDTLRPGDVGSYDSFTTLKPGLDGLVVARGRIVTREGKPVEGPAGAGAYDIVRAGQSLDGGYLAIVQRAPNGVRLRVGRIDAELPEVPLTPTGLAESLTRPTWLLSTSDGMPSEVWTVLNGSTVVRVVRTPDGSWTASTVDSSEFARDGGAITQLRLSRDGVRVAAVVGGEVKLASVVRENDTVSIRVPRTLLGSRIRDVVDIDWLDRQNLIAVTGQSATPVVNMPIDGLTFTAYNSSTLTLPITSVAAAPSKLALVVDSSGMWATQEPGKLWQAYGFDSGTGAVPLYPG